MSTPGDPYAAPENGPAASRVPSYPQDAGQVGQQYGQPQYGQPHGQLQYGQPQYGQAYGNAGGWQGPPLANWFQRVGSALIDGLIVTAIEFVGIGLGPAVGGGFGRLIAAVGYLAALVFFFWNLAQQGRTGQTIGKRALGTRLLREQDGQVVGAGLSIGRAFVHILDALPFYLGFLWPLWDGKKQTFADKILSTVVIKG